MMTACWMNVLPSFCFLSSCSTPCPVAMPPNDSPSRSRRNIRAHQQPQEPDGSTPRASARLTAACSWRLRPTSGGQLRVTKAGPPSMPPEVKGPHHLELSIARLSWRWMGMQRMESTPPPRRGSTRLPPSHRKEEDLAISLLSGSHLEKIAVAWGVGAAAEVAGPSSFRPVGSKAEGMPRRQLQPAPSW